MLMTLSVSLPVLAEQQVEISDMGRAMEFCDRAMLGKIEGIWEFPEDNTRVLIRRSTAEPNLYDIIVVETPDCRLRPGDVIGYLRGSALSTKFEMGLFRTKTEGILSDLRKCLAEYNSKEDALLVKAPKIKLKLRSRWFLPSFWRAVSIGIDNPAGNIPKGLVRIYPSPIPRDPSYL